jgi:hypothetical protein
MENESFTSKLSTAMFWLVGIGTFIALLGGKHSAGEAFLGALVCGALAAFLIHVVSAVLKIVFALAMLFLLLARIASVVNGVSKMVEPPAPKPVVAVEARYEPPAPVSVPVPAAALEHRSLCVYNESPGLLHFAMTIGSFNRKVELEASKGYCFHSANGEPFVIAFDQNFAEGYQDRREVLATNPASGPGDYANANRYELVVRGQSVGIQPKVWEPGFAHPFEPHAVAGKEEGKWTCAAGYRWLNPEANDDLTCVAN